MAEDPPLCARCAQKVPAARLEAGCSSFSWNLAGRVKRLAEQAERLLALDADLIRLQEVTPNTLAQWELLLDEAGYEGITHAEPEHLTDRSRPLIVLTACRGAEQRVAVADVPWPERVLAVRLSDGTELLNVHSPISSKPELAKVRIHEAVYAHLADDTVSHPRILCGDLNTPRKEHADGRVWTFARDQYGRLRTRALRLSRRLPLHPRPSTQGAELGMAALGRRLPSRSPPRISRAHRRGLPLRTRVAQ